MSEHNADDGHNALDNLFTFNPRVQSLFSWRPDDMTKPPQPSFFSFKSLIENPKMKVGNL